MITIVRGLALAAVLSVPTATNAAIIHLTTPLGLTGSQEVPVRVTPGTGTGEAILDTVALTLEVDLTWQDLVAPAAAAHIHCCSSPGANSLVAIDFVPVANTYVREDDLSRMDSPHGVPSASVVVARGPFCAAPGSPRRIARRSTRVHAS